MQHVGQGLDMHQAMLDRDVEESVEWKTVTATTVGFETSVRQLLVESPPNSVHVVAHCVERRPVRRLVGRQSAANGIDTEGKQAIKLWTKTLQTQDVFVEEI